MGSAPSDGELAWRVPGRIELLGKHTDYGGGRSLLCATEPSLCLLSRPLSEAVLRLIAADRGERTELRLDPVIPLPEGHWTAYAVSVIRRLGRDFGPLRRGLELGIASDLPSDAGLSSSSALVVGLTLALAARNGLTERPDWRAAFPDREDLAGYLGAIESGKAFGPFPGDFGVGTQGGSQDHTAILCAQEGRLVQYGFLPVRFECAAPFPPDAILAIGVSGVAAAKTREARPAYNALAEQVASLLERWCSATGRADATLFAALASAPDAAVRLERLLPEAPLRARLRQFTAESFELVPGAAQALRAGDLTGLGTLVDRSQAGAEQGLGNQVPETVHLQRAARRLGAAAASGFGAGFGGSVWALLPAADAERFLNDWREDYSASFPDRRETARFFLTRPAAPAAELSAAALRG